MHSPKPFLSTLELKQLVRQIPVVRIFDEHISQRDVLKLALVVVDEHLLDARLVHVVVLVLDDDLESVGVSLRALPARRTVTHADGQLVAVAAQRLPAIAVLTVSYDDPNVLAASTCV